MFGPRDVEGSCVVGTQRSWVMLLCPAEVSRPEQQGAVVDVRTGSSPRAEEKEWIESSLSGLMQPINQPKWLNMNYFTVRQDFHEGLIIQLCLVAVCYFYK